MDVRRLVITNQDNSPLCRDCGFCCTLVVMSQPAQDWLAAGVTPRECEWITTDLVELTLQEAIETGLLVKGLEHEGLHFYKCQAWDPATGRCIDYNNRPDVCRSFPYYLTGSPNLKVPYSQGCRLGDFLHSLLDLRPGEVKLRKNGHA